MTILPLANKVELLEKQQEHLENIRLGISKVKKEVTSTSGKVIGIGASLLIGYYIFSLFFKEESKIVLVPKDKESENLPISKIETIDESPIVSAIRGYIISFLLSLAKQKIQQFLDELYKKDDGNDLQRTD